MMASKLVEGLRYLEYAGNSSYRVFSTKRLRMILCGFKNTQKCYDTLKT